MYLTLSYWTFVMIIGIVFVLIEQIPAAIIILFVGNFLVCWLPSFLISKLPF